MKKVLACIDGSSYSDSVCDHAAWVSARIYAAVELLNVLPHSPERASLSDLSGTIGVDASAELLDQLTKQDEARGQLEQRKGRLILKHAEQQLRSDGVKEITSIKRRGTLAETICELEGDVEIIVIGKRGELAQYDTMHIGSNLERVARAVHKPLLVTPGTFRTPQKFLIAFDGGVSSTKALEYIIRNPLLKGLECHIVTVVRDSEESRKSLDSATAKLVQAGFDVHSSLETGYPDEAIQSYVDSNNIDLLVIGAYGHSRIRNLIIGSTTTSMIMSCRIPLLLFR
ncbi:MAG: universal stress protein [Deltaproteobacteria bacterium]|nr:universal stress protein [Deltaproteobacteria bacterium]